MPRIRERHERTPLDLWDCLLGRAEPEGYSHRLFSGIGHIGRTLLSNMQVPGQLACDSTAFISGMYARTTIAPSPLFDRVVQNSTVHLIVGSRPQRQMPLAHLFKQQPGSAKMFLDRYTEADRISENYALVDYLAKKMYAQLEDRHPTTLPRLNEDDLRSLAHVALVEMKPPPNLVVVPVRQNFAARIDFWKDSKEAWDEACDRDPEAKLWIHVEGWSSRG